MNRHSDNLENLTKLRQRKVTLEAEIRTLAAKDALTVDEEETFERSLGEYKTASAELVLATNETRSALAGDSSLKGAAGADGAPAQWKQSDRRSAFESTDRSVDARVGHAMRAIEGNLTAAEKLTGARADIAPSVRETMEHHPRAADAVIARSDPAYAAAFAKLFAIGDAGRAYASFTEEERVAFSRVEREHRAANEGTGSAGGYGVPILIDPSIILLGAGAINPFRGRAHTVTGISDIWKGVASVGITANWTAEGAAVADGTPTLTQPSIPAYKGAAFVPYTIELEQDYESFVEQVAMLFLDSRNVLETTAFSVGTGSAQPYGLQTRLTNNTFSQVVSTTHGTIGTADIYNVFAALEPRYRPNSVWLGSAVTQNAIRQAGDDRLGQLSGAGTAAGSTLLPVSADGVNMLLLGHTFYESSGFKDLPAGTTASAAFLTVTDLQKSYVIFDRMNSANVELVSHLFDTSTGMPLGQRGAWYSWRVGGDATNGTGVGATGAKTLMNKTS
jgi:HK97 family phage major capsid protein